MTLKNKLHLTNAVDLAREEERISKKKAVELFESGYLDTLKPGSLEALQRRFTPICSRKSMILPVRFAPSTWQRETSALHR